MTSINLKSLRKLLNSPFTILDDFNSKVFLVVFCAIFSTFFIYFYNPFNLLQVTYDTAIGYWLSIGVAGLLGSLIIAFAQFFLRPKFKLVKFNLGQFLLWMFFEFMIICWVVYFLFGESIEPFYYEFLLIIQYTFSIAIIPYILACLFISVRKLTEKVNEKNIDLVIKEKSIHSNEPHIFKDENGKLILAIKPKQIIFLKSENNYTSIFYFRNEKIERKLIRTTLKKLEEDLTYPEIIRIHRSYIVNLQNIQSVNRKKGGFELEMNHFPEISIKVSETYKPIFKEKIENLALSTT